jgi:hypothetical protein
MFSGSVSANPRRKGPIDQISTQKCRSSLANISNNAPIAIAVEDPRKGTVTRSANRMNADRATVIQLPSARMSCSYLNFFRELNRFEKKETFGVFSALRVAPYYERRKPLRS